MKRDHGFTLIELLIVFAIIGLIAAFTVPRLLRARATANESSAIASLKSLTTAQDLFARVCGNGGYASSFVVLGTPPPGTNAAFLSDELTTAVAPQKSGYQYSMALSAGASVGPSDCIGNPTQSGYYVAAAPLTFGSSGNRAFATNHATLVWQSISSSAPTEPFGPPSAPVR